MKHRWILSSSSDFRWLKCQNWTTIFTIVELSIQWHVSLIDVISDTAMNYVGSETVPELTFGWARFCQYPDNITSKVSSENDPNLLVSFNKLSLIENFGMHNWLSLNNNPSWIIYYIQALLSLTTRFSHASYDSLNCGSSLYISLRCSNPKVLTWFYTTFCRSWWYCLFSDI